MLDILWDCYNIGNHKIYLPLDKMAYISQTILSDFD